MRDALLYIYGTQERVRYTARSTLRGALQGVIAGLSAGGGGSVFMDMDGPQVLFTFLVVGVVVPVLTAVMQGIPGSREGSAPSGRS